MPVLVDEPHEFPADLLGEHLAHHTNRLVRGDPIPAAEFAGDAAARQLGGDLWPTTMYHHGLDARVTQVDHVLREGALQVVIDHGVATKLHHDDLVVEPLEPRKCLNEDGRLGRCLIRADHQLEYALFSCT